MKPPPTNQYAPIAQDIRAKLCCPACRGELADTQEALACSDCHTSYDYPAGGRPDLRLRDIVERKLIHRVGKPPLSTDEAVSQLSAHPKPAVDFAGVKAPRHLTQDLLSHFPRASTHTSLALDLGCGRAIHREVVEHAGFGYAAIDYREEGAPMLADAHALPFVDESFEFVLSVAVLEHIRDPSLMMQEAARVLKPGGKLIGTVAFLEPWHDHSYFHHSHLGVINLLEQSGLTVELVAPNRRWSVLKAQAKTLFPVMPKRLAQTIVLPLHLLHRLWWAPIGWRSKKYAHLRRLKTAGAFTFIARKPTPDGQATP